MSPTPVTFASPDQPASYSWEATDEEVAARYGLPLDSIVRFDLNTSPAPPGLASRLLAAGRFESPLSEYPPSDYRRLVEAAASTYGVATEELLVGAGADEILDLIGKSFLPAGGEAVIPAPSYAMYRVVTEQRGARATPCRAARPRSAGRSTSTRSRRQPAPRRSSGSAARTTRPAGRAAGRDRGASSTGSRRRAPWPPADRRSSPSTRPTRSSAGNRCSTPAKPTRISSSSGPPARPTPWPGCASGSRSPSRPRSPGSRRTARPARSRRSASRSSRRRSSRRGHAGQRGPGRRRTATASPRRLDRCRLVGRTVRHELPAGPFAELPRPRRARPMRCSDAASSRGRFRPAIPLADSLRLTVRDAAENDRLIAAPWRRLQARPLADQPPDLQLALADSDRQPLPGDWLRDGVVRATRRGRRHGQAATRDQPARLPEGGEQPGIDEESGDRRRGAART